MKNIKKVIVGVAIATGIVVGVVAVNTNKVWADYDFTRAQNKEITDLYNSGVAIEVAVDEIIEKYQLEEAGRVNYSGTGGLDGVVSEWAAKTFKAKKNNICGKTSKASMFSRMDC